MSLDAFRKYAAFSTRASRTEYWTIFALSLVLTIALSGVGTALGGPPLLAAVGTSVVMVPALVRRLHDTGRTGWWLLVVVVPIAGPLTLLIFTLLPSQPSANWWGPPPAGRSTVSPVMLVQPHAPAAPSTTPETPAGVPAGDASSVLTLDSFIITRDIAGQMFSTKNKAVVGLRDMSGTWVAFAAMELNQLSDAGREQRMTGVELRSIQGELLLIVKRRQAFVWRTHVIDILEPGGSVFGTFTHKDFTLRDRWSFAGEGGLLQGLVVERRSVRMLLRLIPLLGKFFGDEEYDLRIGHRDVAKVYNFQIALHATMAPDIQSRTERLFVVAWCLARALS